MVRIGDMMGKKLLALCIGIIFVLLLSYGSLNYEMSKLALTIWFEKLVPSMFGIMVLVKLMFYTGILQIIAYPFGVVLGRLFRIEPDSFLYVIAMIFLGFPAGAAFIADQVSQQRLEERAGKRLINTCSFATPGFVIMTCGSVLFHSVRIGFLLFLIQVISGLLLLLFTRKTVIHKTSLSTSSMPFMSALSKSMLESGTTLYMIGGYLMLCMSMFSVLTQFLPISFQLPIRILSEFSSGAVLLSETSLSLKLQLVLLSMLLSFGGLCVHMQVMSMGSSCHLSYRSYCQYRIIQALLSGILTFLLYSFLC